MNQPAINNSLSKGRHTLFLLCLLSPIVFSTIRKLMPSQPDFLEPGGSVVVLAVAVFFWFTTHRQGQKKLPLTITLLLWIWALFQIGYAIPSVFYNYRIGAFAIMTRVVPLFMPFIAYQGIRNFWELDRVRLIFGLFAIALLPFGIQVALYGQQAVPRFLQQNQAMFILGKTARLGIPAFAGPFTTMLVLSMVFLAVTYIHLSCFNQKRQKMTSKLTFLAGLIASILLVYLSTRRGAFYALFPGLFVLALSQRIKFNRKILVVISIIIFAIVAYTLDLQSTVMRTSVESRHELFKSVDFEQRFRGVFLGHFIKWAEAEPLGTFLGAAGPLGRLLGSPLIGGGSVEVGGAMIVAEMGIAGALLLPFIVIYIGLFLHHRALRTQFYILCLFLLIFQAMFFTLFYFKERSTFTSCSFALLFFWSVPGIIMGLLHSQSNEQTARQ